MDVKIAAQKSIWILTVAIAATMTGAPLEAGMGITGSRRLGGKCRTRDAASVRMSFPARQGRGEAKSGEWSFFRRIN